MVRSKRSCSRCCATSLIYLFTLFLVLLFVVFMIVPFIFKYSVSIQRNLIFPTWATEEANFSDIDSFGIKGVRNFYIPVDVENNITLGTWQIIPSAELSDIKDNNQYNYEQILANKNYDILLYLHGNGGIRSIPLELYEILREYFQIIACDYRGYGDSTKGELTEDHIVNDIVDLYHWLRNKTESRIFFWGHSLGTGVSTHVIANLKKEESIPAGLVLEAPFSAVIDVVERHPIAKLYSWLPWYDTTILDPMVTNGFGFNSTKYIKDVDCPIMIIHAKDDTIIPYDLATKLYDTAVKNRTLEQGNVTYHLFEAKGYDHMELYSAPEIPLYTKRFIDECLAFEAQHANPVLNNTISE